MGKREPIKAKEEGRNQAMQTPITIMRILLHSYSGEAIEQFSQIRASKGSENSRQIFVVV